MVLEAYVRVGKWQLFPLLLEPLKTYSGAPTSENLEISAHVLHIHAATGGQGTWLLDRGFDRDALMLPWLRKHLAFVIRQRGDRHVLSQGRTVAMTQLAQELKPAAWPRRWPQGGYTVSQEVSLPEMPEQRLLLVVHWRWPRSTEPLLLLASPAARRPRRPARWFVKAYGRRWGVEDATWGIKQRLQLESFLVRSWLSLRRLLWLVAWSFFWLNLWGEPRFDRLREALMNHPWRLPKEVTYLFDWIATQIGYLLHPKPRFGVTAEET